MYRTVPQIRPHFCNLSLSTKRRGAACMRDATISLAITPSLPVKNDLIVIFSGGWGLSVRWRDAPDASSRLMSFSV